MAIKTPLVDVESLQRLLAGDAPPVLLDCRHDLADPEAGRRAYAEGHIPGAHHLHLDDDLAGPKTGDDGRFRGRHPLPERPRWARRAGALGIGPRTPVVVYDAQGGMVAARAWWMLRWLGHEAVAVLDGGWAAWVQAGGAVETATPAEPEGPPYPASDTPAMPTIEADELQRRLGTLTVVDARAGERFRGEVEPLDAVAGHIPGGRNRPFADNLQPDGRFKPADQLRAEWAPLAAGGRPLVQQCGSGVSACHNILALAHAGLDGGLLYPGSWSEWSSDPARPVARG